MGAAPSKPSGMSGNLLDDDDDEDDDGEGLFAAEYDKAMRCKESREHRWGQYTGKIPKQPAHLSSSFCPQSSSTNHPSTFKEATSQVASPIKKESASLKEETWLSSKGDEE